MRIGQGVDVHRFADTDDRPLILGGVRIPAGTGLEGHSDADVVLHALVDALLGAAGLGDIGTMFGSSDPRYEGASSAVFVEEALERLEPLGLGIANIDCVVIAQRPRVGPHQGQIAASIARIAQVDQSQVNVKSTTTDGLGFTGRGEGIACLLTVLLV